MRLETTVATIYADKLKYWTVAVWNAGYQPVEFSHDVFARDEISALAKFLDTFPHFTSVTSANVTEVA